MTASPAKSISPERAQKQRELIAALDEAWYLPDEDKLYWIENIETMPSPMLEATTNAIKAKSNLVDKYVGTALEEDKDHMLMAELKNKVLTLKKKAFSIDESAEKGDIEEDLSKKLQEIDG
jgi:hypothetical protein